MCSVQFVTKLMPEPDSTEGRQQTKNVSLLWFLRAARTPRWGPPDKKIPALKEFGKVQVLQTFRMAHNRYQQCQTQRKQGAQTL